MSGGALNYFSCDLENHAKDFDDPELEDLILDLTLLYQEREWYLSGDSGEGLWNKTRDWFKKKWLMGEGREERFDRYFNEMINNFKRSIGISVYCKDCERWTPRDEEETEYGRCELQEHCLIHEYDSTCKVFKPRKTGE